MDLGTFSDLLTRANLVNSNVCYVDSGTVIAQHNAGVDSASPHSILGLQVWRFRRHIEASHQLVYLLVFDADLALQFLVTVSEGVVDAGEVCLVTLQLFDRRLELPQLGVGQFKLAAFLFELICRSSSWLRWASAWLMRARFVLSRCNCSIVAVSSRSRAFARFSWLRFSLS